MKVDLVKDLKEFIDIEIDDTRFRQRVVYVNLSNTCYRCQFVAHKIKDCPLMVDKFKNKATDTSSLAPSTLVQPTKGDHEEWTIVFHKKVKNAKAS